jgi:cytochrome c oxidase subunit 3
MVGLGSVLMMFTALTSAYIVRAGISNDWRPIAMPPLVFVSTGLILLSSFVIEAARRSLRNGDVMKSRNLLFITLLLGLGFVGTQLLTWQQLVAQGIYVSSNPHSSFFYVLTGLHGLHLLGGILALNYLLLRSWNRTKDDLVAEGKRQTLTDVVTLYWHFMDGLWVFCSYSFISGGESA